MERGFIDTNAQGVIEGVTVTHRFRFIPTDSYTRDPGKDFTQEAIAEQIAKFEAGGGKIQRIPSGIGVEAHKTLPNTEQRRRTSQGNRRVDIQYSKRKSQ